MHAQSSGAPSVNLLRERVLLERLESTPDETGGSTPLWNAVVAVWANIRLEGAPTAQLSGERLSERVKWRIFVRYRRDIRPGMRFRIMGDGVSMERMFRILAASNEDGKRRFLKCICEEQG
jgi:SPP1 family predicted phage head-tail adaptor